MAETVDYELTEAEGALLIAAAEDAAAAAGALGGSIGGALGGGVAGAAGGAKGGGSRRVARWGVKRTKPQTAQTAVEVALSPGAARERAAAAIAEGGALIEDPNAANDGSIWGIVGSGTMNMAPALVRVQVDADEWGGSRVTVRATGREALLKQKIGAKAADRIAEAVSQA